jgi:hypothetical protein
MRTALVTGWRAYDDWRREVLSLCSLRPYADFGCTAAGAG